MIESILEPTRKRFSETALIECCISNQPKARRARAMNAPKMPKMPIAQHRHIASLYFPFYLADRKQQMTIYYTYKISLYSKSNYDTDKALCRRIGRAGQVCEENRCERRLCEEHTQWVLLLLLLTLVHGFLPLSFNRGEGKLCEEFETMKFETVSAQRWINVDGT